ncbi:hypothetical protein [Weissella cibaria]|uniref:hypothetical protein n=1 Tax=Weissella cibaria TaxID=137591 RepID=UPI00223A6ABA|nr:hypothetical protein [Weissella cibaria]MCS8562453.1 hypothetical protein [Weissella cibaria]MCS8566386.1 hypothetical protein [Weissella cibaria]MCS8576194.1 hypothetical protein [Weissella cibaria]
MAVGLNLGDNDNLKYRTLWIQEFFEKDLETQHTESEDVSRFIEYTIEIMGVENSDFPHELVADYVYKHYDSVHESKSRSEEVIWHKNYRFIQKSDINFNETTKHLLSKLNSNIRIAITQYELIAAKDEALEENLEKKVSKLQETIESLESKAIKLQKDIDSYYSNFISVLGIFIAISFSLFAGATVVTKLLSLTADTKSAIGANIMFAGFSTFLVYVLILGLVIGIGKITNKGYDFSYRVLFVISSLCGSTVLFGFLYRSNFLGRDQLYYKSVGIVIFALVMYAALSLFLFKKGTKFKNFMIETRKSK